MASRMLLALRSSSYIRASAFHRAFSSAMPSFRSPVEKIEEDKIAAEMKALFEEHSVKIDSTLDEKESLSVDEEKMNLEMKNWHKCELNRLINEHKLKQKTPRSFDEQNVNPEMQNICETMPGYNPPMLEMVDEDKIAEQMKTLFPEHSVKGDDAKLEKKVDDETLNQEMDKWENSVLQKMFDDQKVDPEESTGGEYNLIRSFTMKGSDGRIVSGANMYRVYDDGKRKLLHTIAWECDENGKKIKPFEGEVYLTDDFIDGARYKIGLKPE